MDIPGVIVASALSLIVLFAAIGMVGVLTDSRQWIGRAILGLVGLTGLYVVGALVYLWLIVLGLV